MSNIPDDELISAYLDGELSGELLARAERLLAAQPESRQLLDELKALRAGLQALPRHTLEPDFAAEVLRRASGAAQPSPERRSAATSGATTAPDWESPPVLSWQRWKRPLIWSALAAAAALLVMVLSPDDRQPQIARAPAPAAAPGDAEMHAAAPGVHEPLARQESLEDNMTIAPKATSATSQSRFNVAATAQATPDEEAEIAEQFAIVQQTARALDEQETLPGQIKLNAYLNQAAQDPADNEGLLVVVCDVTSPVAESKAFRDLLARQQISYDEAPLDGDSRPSKRLPSDAAPGASGERLAALAGGKAAAAGDEQQASDRDAVYVVASPDQLRGALEAVAADRAFQNVNVGRVAANTTNLSLTEGVENRSAGNVAAPAAVPRAQRLSEAATKPKLSDEKAGQAAGEESSKTGRGAGDNAPRAAMKRSQKTQLAPSAAPAPRAATDEATDAPSDLKTPATDDSAAQADGALGGGFRDQNNSQTNRARARALRMPLQQSVNQQRAMPQQPAKDTSPGANAPAPLESPAPKVAQNEQRDKSSLGRAADRMQRGAAQQNATQSTTRAGDGSVAQKSREQSIISLEQNSADERPAQALFIFRVVPDGGAESK